MTIRTGSERFNLTLKSGGTVIIDLPNSATVDDLKTIAGFVYTDDRRRLQVKSDIRKSFDHPDFEGGSRHGGDRIKWEWMTNGKGERVLVYQVEE